MKPNEIIGLLAWIGIFADFILSFKFGFSLWFLAGIAFFGMISTVFLSLWGLTTFNSLFAERFGNEKYEYDSQKFLELDVADDIKSFIETLLTKEWRDSFKAGYERGREETIEEERKRILAALPSKRFAELFLGVKTYENKAYNLLLTKVRNIISPDLTKDKE